MNYFLPWDQIFRLQKDPAISQDSCLCLQVFFIFKFLLLGCKSSLIFAFLNNIGNNILKRTEFHLIILSVYLCMFSIIYAKIHVLCNSPRMPLSNLNFWNLMCKNLAKYIWKHISFLLMNYFHFQIFFWKLQKRFEICSDIYYAKWGSGGVVGLWQLGNKMKIEVEGKKGKIALKWVKSSLNLHQI